MATDLTPPDPSVVLDLIEAFRRSKVLFAAVALGVFDALATGPKPAATLAAELPANADALERLLDACVGLRLLDRLPTGYANTPASAAYLCRTSPARITGYINYSNDVLWQLWSHLEDAVREGTHRWKQTYGWDGPIFAHFFRTEESKREFLMGMHGQGLLSSPQVVSAFDLGRFQHVVRLDDGQYRPRVRLGGGRVAPVQLHEPAYRARHPDQQRMPGLLAVPERVGQQVVRVLQRFPCGIGHVHDFATGLCALCGLCGHLPTKREMSFSFSMQM